jgi:hypothetical protein
MASILFKNEDPGFATYYTQKREIRFASLHAFEWCIKAKIGIRS